MSAVYFGPLRTVVRILGGLLHGLAVVSFASPTLAQPDGTIGLNRFDPRDGTSGLEPRLAAAAGDLQNKPPSLYTGAMRLLAQYHYASGPATPLPYSSTYQASHGLYIATDGNPWIIDIAPGSGVYAIRLETDEAAAVNAGAPNDKGGFTFTPRIESLPAKTDPRWRQLADATAFAAVAGGPWANEGWAFNADGTEAVIVTIGTQGVYFYTRLFKVSITAGNVSVPQTPPDPPLDVPMPIAATVSELEGGYLWQPRRGDRTRLKVPSNNTIVSRDNLWAGQTTPPIPAFVSPVYAYYKDNTLQVARWHYDQGSSTNETVPEPALTETGTFGTFAESTGVQCYSTPQLAAASNASKSGNFTTRSRPVTVQGMVHYSGHSAAESASAIVDATKINGDESSAVWDTLIIPIRDREAVYHFRETVTRDKHDGAARDHRGWLIPPGPVFVYGDGLPSSVRGNMNWASFKASYAASGWVTPWPEPFRDYFKLDNMQHGPTVRAAPQVAASVTVYDNDLGEPRWNYYAWSNDDTGNTAEEAARELVEGAGTVNWTFVRNELRGGGGPYGGAPYFTYGSPGSGWEQYVPVRRFVLGQLNRAQIVMRAGLKAFDPTPNTPTIDESSEAAKDEITTIAEAVLNGSIASPSIAVIDGEIEWWVRKAQGDFKQVWLVAQDAAPNAQIIYSKTPAPDGGALPDTLDGSTEYQPDSITSELLSWIGRP